MIEFSSISSHSTQSIHIQLNIENSQLKKEGTYLLYGREFVVPIGHQAKEGANVWYGKVISARGAPKSFNHSLPLPQCD